MVNTVLTESGRLRCVMTTALACVAAVSCIVSPLAAQAQSSSGTNDEWKFTVVPYLMIPRMDRTAEVLGQPVDVNLGSRQIFKNLQFGVMGYFEARIVHGWAVSADAVYMALGNTVDRVPVLGVRASNDVDFNQRMYTFTALRQLNRKVNLLAGVLKETKQWVNPIIGVKFKQSLGGPFNFTLRRTTVNLGPDQTSHGTCFQLSARIWRNELRSVLGIG